MIIQKNTYHFSVDDVFDSLIDASDQKPPLFRNPFFQFLKNLHGRFGTNVDLYLFYQGKINNRMRTLKDVPSSLKDILAENGWLRFGPHALDCETAPYSQPPREQMDAFNAIYSEIDRFSGSRSKLVRLHYFSESYELATYFKKKGVSALLSTDRDAISHRMPERIKRKLKATGIANYKGISFVRSSFRSEDFADENLTPDQIGSKIRANLNTFGFVTLFSHGYEIPRLEVRQATVSALRYLKDQKVLSV